MLSVRIHREKEANSLKMHAQFVKFYLGFESGVEKDFYLIQHLLQNDKSYLPNLSCPFLLQLFLSTSSYLQILSVVYLFCHPFVGSMDLN